MRAVVLEDYMAAARCDAGMCARCGVIRGRATHVDLRIIGGDDLQRQTWERIDGATVYQNMAPPLAELPDRNTIDNATEPRSAESGRYWWGPSRLVSSTLLDVVTQCGTHAGFLLAFRHGDQSPISADELAELEARRPGYVAAMSAAIDRHEAHPLPPGSLTVRQDGSIFAASAMGHVIAQVPHVMEHVRRHLGPSKRTTWANGCTVKITPLIGGGEPLWDVDVEPCEAWKVPSVTRLPRTLRAVAQRAAEGATVAEIAELVGKSRSTVRAYIAEIYSELGISTRAELARMVAEIM